MTIKKSGEKWSFPIYFIEEALIDFVDVQRFNLSVQVIVSDIWNQRDEPEVDAVDFAKNVVYDTFENKPLILIIYLPRLIDLLKCFDLIHDDIVVQDFKIMEIILCSECSIHKKVSKQNESLRSFIRICMDAFLRWTHVNHELVDYDPYCKLQLFLKNIRNEY
jgi:hypothetical protein